MFYHPWKSHHLFTRPAEEQCSSNNRISRDAIRYIQRSPFRRLLHSERRRLGFRTLLPPPASRDPPRADLPAHIPSLHASKHALSSPRNSTPVPVGAGLVYGCQPELFRRVQTRRGVGRRAGAGQRVPGDSRRRLVALGTESGRTRLVEMAR